MAYLGKSVEKEMHFGAKPELFKYAQEMRKNPPPLPRERGTGGGEAINPGADNGNGEVKKIIICFALLK